MRCQELAKGRGSQLHAVDEKKRSERSRRLESARIVARPVDTRPSEACIDAGPEARVIDAGVCPATSGNKASHAFTKRAGRGPVGAAIGRAINSSACRGQQRAAACLQQRVGTVES